MSAVEGYDEGLVDRAVERVLLDGSRWAVAVGSPVSLTAVLVWKAAADLAGLTNPGRSDRTGERDVFTVELTPSAYG